ncbi:hypothetical protein GN956_G855 [Arapaima gigas]
MEGEGDVEKEKMSSEQSGDKSDTKFHGEEINILRTIITIIFSISISISITALRFQVPRGRQVTPPPHL